MKIKDWDWTIECTEKGFIFFEMLCLSEYGGGRFTKEETEKASKEFGKIDNPEILRTRQEGCDLIDLIRSKL